MAISMTFEGVDHKFCGSLLMVIASNLAAHALGVFFVTFQLFRDSAGFSIAAKIK